MIKKFIADLWARTKSDILPTLTGTGLATAALYVAFFTDWVTVNLGSRWYAVPVAALLQLVGAWIDRKRKASALAL